MEKMSCAQRIRQGLTVRGMRQRIYVRPQEFPKAL